MPRHAHAGELASSRPRDRLRVGLEREPAIDCTANPHRHRGPTRQSQEPCKPGTDQAQAPGAAWLNLGLRRWPNPAATT